jgi:hypothetical protein
MSDNNYSFCCDSHGSDRNITIQGDLEYLAYILYKLGAKDSISEPRSFRAYTYDEMSQLIDSGEMNTIFLWLHNLNKIKNNRFYDS